MTNHPRWKEVPGPWPGPETAPLDFDRIEPLAARALAAIEPEHARFLAVLIEANGGNVLLEEPDDHGLLRLAIDDPIDGHRHTIGAAHWTTLAPTVTDLDDVQPHWRAG